MPENMKQTLEQALLISQTLSSPRADVHETAMVAAELYFLIDDHFQGHYQSVNPFSAPLDQSQVEQTIGNFGRTARKISEKIDNREPNKSPSTDNKKDTGFEWSDKQNEASQPSSSRPSHQSEDMVRKLLIVLFHYDVFHWGSGFIRGVLETKRLQEELNMFKVLPEGAYSVKIGFTPPKARFYQGSPKEVRALLADRFPIVHSHLLSRLS